MPLEGIKSRKANRSSGISCGALRYMQVKGWPLDNEGSNELLLLVCRCIREVAIIRCYCSIKLENSVNVEGDVRQHLCSCERRRGHLASSRSLQHTHGTS